MTIFGVSKSIHFSYGHRLIRHAGKCQRYHGHNAVAEIHCSSEQLDENGMVIDFEKITGALKQWIDETLDHRMILNAEDDMIDLLKKQGQSHYVIDGEPTAERIAQIILDEAKRRSLPVSSIRLWESPTSSAICRA